jgi:hypothetical protein
MWGLLALFKDIFPKCEPVTGQTLNYTAVLQICQRLEFSLYLVKPLENQGLSRELLRRLRRIRVS